MGMDSVVVGSLVSVGFSVIVLVFLIVKVGRLINKK